MFERFDEACQRAVVDAQKEARRLDHDHVGPEHLLLGLTSEDGLARTVLADLGVDRARVLAAITAPGAEPSGAAGTGPVPLTEAAVAAVRRAADQASDRRAGTVGTADLLLGVLDDDGPAGRVLASLGVARADARDRVLAALLAGGGDQV